MWCSSLSYLCPLSVTLIEVTYEDLELVHEHTTLKLFYPMVAEAGILVDSNPSVRDKTKGLNEDTSLR